MIFEARISWKAWRNEDVDVVGAAGYVKTHPSMFWSKRPDSTGYGAQFALSHILDLFLLRQQIKSQVYMKARLVLGV